MSISLSQVWKSYGEKQVLQGVDFTLEAGVFYALTGESGCGKTTLLRLLMELEEPDSGGIAGLKGVRTTAVFQEDRLCEQLTALDNVMLCCPKEFPRQEAKQALATVGLGDAVTLSQPVRLLSGGMRRRTALVRAVLAPGELLLLDEPFKGLDHALRQQVVDWLVPKLADKTVLLVSHDPWEAALAEKRFCLENGKIREAGPHKKQ